ncbi:MAG: peptide deformylase [Patescibacteria group bacterium]
MAKRKIVTIPNAILRAKAVSLEKNAFGTPSIRQLVQDMAETMAAADGIGLAAPQVGTRERVFIVATKNGALAFCNPKIVKHSFLKITMEEGCLSIPGVFGTVKRPRRIQVEACDVEGKPFRTTADGLLARVIQHELDHLNGILFIDKVIRITRGEKPANT